MKDCRVSPSDTANDDVSSGTSRCSKTDIRSLIEAEEEKKGIPIGLLNSIAAVESEHDPFAVNFSSKSYHFKSKYEAVKFINTSIENGGRNISIGCLQLHYKTHGIHFRSIDYMITPENNISYAAHLLKELHDRYGSWKTAVKMYHHNKAKYNEGYYEKVIKKYNTLYRKQTELGFASKDDLK
jgi:hypothetical protein